MKDDVDWAFDAIRRKTAEGNYEAVNYHRFADDIVITVSGHSSKRGWADLALQRLWENLEPLGVELNVEKTRMVNVLKGESFAFLGFDLRRVPNRKRTGYFIMMTPRKHVRHLKQKFGKPSKTEERNKQRISLNKSIESLPDGSIIFVLETPVVHSVKYVTIQR